MEKQSRRKSRENTFLLLFGSAFGNSVDDVVEAAREEQDAHAPDAFGEGLLTLYKNNAAQIDQIIEAKLKGWNVKRLQKVNLAILRLSVAEMLYGEPGMDSVVINEAVELAKRYGDEQDYQFINGVLGSVSRERTGTPTEEADAPTEVP